LDVQQKIANSESTLLGKPKIFTKQRETFFGPTYISYVVRAYRMGEMLHWPNETINGDEDDDDDQNDVVDDDGDRHKYGDDDKNEDNDNDVTHK